MISWPRRPVLWAASGTALSLLGDQALYALLPIYFESLGLVPIQVGIILSANRWIRLLTNHLAHQVGGRLRSDLLLSVALLLGALITFGYALTTSFTLLLLMRLLWGFCWSFIRHIGIATVARHAEGYRTGQDMGFYNGISRIGSVLGILAGGLLFDLLGFVPTLVIFGLVSLGAVPCGYLSQKDVDTKAAFEAWRLQGSEMTAHTGLLVCGFVLGCVGPGLIMATLGHVLNTRYGDTVELAGLVIGIATLNGILLGMRWMLDGFAAPLFGAWVDQHGLRRGSLTFFIAGTLALLFVAFNATLLSLTLGVLVFFASATALQAVIAGEASRRGSRFFAHYATAGDIGAAVGPLLGWMALEYAGYENVIFLLGALFYFIGVVVIERSVTPARDA